MGTVTMVIGNHNVAPAEDVRVFFLERYIQKQQLHVPLMWMKNAMRKKEEMKHVRALQIVSIIYWQSIDGHNPTVTKMYMFMDNKCYLETEEYHWSIPLAQLNITEKSDKNYIKIMTTTAVNML
ncbi:hypothetical protein ACJX0J_041539, partial [Zea mays]